MVLRAENELVSYLTIDNFKRKKLSFEEVSVVYSVSVTEVWECKVHKNKVKYWQQFVMEFFIETKKSSQHKDSKKIKNP